jgi:transposase
MSNDGFPLTCETWPGNTADIKSVQRVLTLLKKRFGIPEAVLVCDRGMVSAANLRRIRRAGMHCIIGVRMRRFNEVRREVLSRAGRYKVVAGNLHVKQVWIGKHRYIVCHNPEETERDRMSGEAMLEKLEAEMAAGQVKALIGNRGYRTYLRIDKDAVTLDRAKILEEARFEGRFVIRTSTDMTPAQIAIKYKMLFQVEALNRIFKDVLDTRPMYHEKASRVPAHIFGSFLALTLATALRKMVEARLERNDDLVEFIEWKRMIEDVKAVDAIKLKLNDRAYIVRTELQGLAAHTFAAAGVRPPPRVQPWSECPDSGGDVVSNCTATPANQHPAWVLKRQVSKMGLTIERVSV